MKLIIIDRKAWEHLRSSFADFIHSVQLLIGNPPEAEQWIDNEAVCRRLGISKRTLQTYRDTGKIPFSMIGHKCYYKESDITEILKAINNELKQWMNYDREWNHYGTRPSDANVYSIDGGYIKEVGALLRQLASDIDGEVYLTGEEVCKQLRLSTRTLQEYRNNGTIAYYKIGGKILYRQGDIQTMLEKHYYPISKKPWQL